MKRSLPFLPFLVALSLLAALGFALNGASLAAVHGAGSASAASTLATSRAEDPVEITGAAMANFDGVPITEVVVYAYDGGAWSPIPFQIDEVTAAGEYTSTEDGLLDSNDVLVFMARDLGVVAPPGDWPADVQARAHNRQIVLASDPLSDAKGVAYVYRSATLTRSVTTYVTWDQNAQSLTTPVYTAAFDPANFIGLATLSLHGGPDVLDRQKIRVSGKVGGILPFSLNEEQIASTVGVPATIELTVQGPIRAVRSGSALNVAFYRERFAFETVLDTSQFNLPGTIESLRTSLDLNDPAATGLTRFLDSNGSDVAIDGSPDVVGSSPIFKWYQVSGDGSGSGAGPGGMVIAFPQLAVSGSIGNYYLDNGTEESADTGDKKSFADTGLTINNPGERSAITLAGMILPQGTSANVGESVYSRTTTPIAVTVSPAPYLDPTTIQEIFLPSVLR